MKTKFDELNEKITECYDFAEENNLQFLCLISDDEKIAHSFYSSTLFYTYMLVSFLKSNPVLIKATKLASILAKTKKNGK